MESESHPVDMGRQLLRHALATVAYRGAKVLRAAPEGFSEFRAAPTTRTPGEILAHLGDLFCWALSIAQGQQSWHDSSPQPWDQELQRFFHSLAAFDNFLASGETLGAPAEKLLQGPIADSLTHIGQLAMLRRIAGSPVRGENYFRADIMQGRVGPNQNTPRREFD